QDPNHQYTVPGNYTVILTVNDTDGDADTETKVGFILVIADEVPVVNFTSNATEIIEGESVQFNYTGTAGNGITSYQWDFGDGSGNSTLQDPIHQYISPGNYAIVLTVIDTDGDTNTSNFTYVITVTKHEDERPGPTFIEKYFLPLILVVSAAIAVAVTVAIIKRPKKVVKTKKNIGVSKKVPITQKKTIEKQGVYKSEILESNEQSLNVKNYREILLDLQRKSIEAMNKQSFPEARSHLEQMIEIARRLNDPVLLKNYMENLEKINDLELRSNSQGS
ncbi:MAG: PKD domain-containing protein, partial [Candidatus Hodarchaeota archaeon]